MSKKNHKEAVIINENIKNALCAVICMIFVIMTVSIIAVKFSSEAVAGDVFGKPDKDWFYYEDYMGILEKGEDVVEFKIYPDDFNPDDYVICEPDVKMQKKITTAKDLLKKKLGKYKDLDWDHLETVPFKGCKFTFTDSPLVAFFSPEDNAIYYDVDLVQGTGDELLLTNLVHEMIHVLAPVKGSPSMMDEALTSHITNEVYPSNYKSYAFSLIFIERYLESHKLKEAIDYMREGTLCKKVEEDIGRPDVLKNTKGVLSALDSGASYQYGLLVFTDTYAHYVANTGGIDTISQSNLTSIYTYLSDTKDNREAIKYFTQVIYGK